jgi:hypothetical protein
MLVPNDLRSADKIFADLRTFVIGSSGEAAPNIVGIDRAIALKRRPVRRSLLRSFGRILGVAKSEAAGVSNDGAKSENAEIRLSEFTFRNPRSALRISCYIFVAFELTIDSAMSS